MPGGKYNEAAMAAMEQMGVGPEDDMGEVTATKKAAPKEKPAPKGSSDPMEIVQQMFEDATQGMDDNMKMEMLQQLMQMMQGGGQQMPPEQMMPPQQ